MLSTLPAVIGIQVIALAAQLYLSRTEHIDRIYIVTLMFNICNMLLYIGQSNTVASLSLVVIVIRSAFYIYKPRLKLYKHHDMIPYIFMLLQAIPLAFMSSPTQLLSVIAPCYVTWYMWFYNDTQKLRIGNVINATLWGIYAAISGLYIIVVCRIIAVMMNVSAYRDYNRSIVHRSRYDRL